MIISPFLITPYVYRASRVCYQDEVPIIGILSQPNPYNVNFITAFIQINDNFLDNSRYRGQDPVCLYGVSRDTNLLANFLVPLEHNTAEGIFMLRNYT